MSSKVVWRGEEAKKLVTDKFGQRLERACIFLSNSVKELISVPSDHGKSPSSEGDYPHKDTGRLRASISYETDGKSGRVGSNVLYAKFLELGTKTMAARPFLRSTLDARQADIKRILRGG